MEIINGEPRRRWSDDDKLAIVAETISTGNVTRTARLHGVNPSMVWAWRKKFGSGGLQTTQDARPGFVPVALIPDGPPAAACTSSSPQASVPPGLIEVALAGGIQLRISGCVDAELAASVTAALIKR